MSRIITQPVNSPSHFHRPNKTFSFNWGWSSTVTDSFTFLTAEIWQSHVLQRNLFKESGSLTPRVARDDLATPQPIAQPSQPAVAVKGVRQQVPSMEIELHDTGFKAEQSVIKTSSFASSVPSAARAKSNDSETLSEC